LDIYLKRKRRKLLLLIIAILIGFGSLYYTNWLTEKMAQEERNKVELWAEATKGMAGAFIESQSHEMEQLNTNYLNFLNLVISQNNSIPIIIIEKDGSFNIDKNITYHPEKRIQILTKELEKMKNYSEPIPIELSEDNIHFLYFRESTILRNLRYYPFIQLFVVLIFIVVAYLAFSSSRKAEQNQVWVGMSKETAHQLGTPISSLMAWTELLKLQNVDENLIQELEKDTQRLEKITERFSKIGSKPELLHTNLIEVLYSTISYLKTRSSSKVTFVASFNHDEKVEIPLNASLFSWVIENLCKNAIDAMDNHGIITIQLTEKDNSVIIDVSDTGKGVHKSQYKTIFQPGYSTKKRGWGLGLSLAKRIIENYHQGKIFIKSSEIGKGTTFRILLNK
jgi:sensor histidine kinase YesM